MIKDNLLKLSDAVRYQFKKFVFLLKKVPWGKVVSFLNQYGVAAKATDYINKRRGGK